MQTNLLLEIDSQQQNVVDWAQHTITKQAFEEALRLVSHSDTEKVVQVFFAYIYGLEYLIQDPRDNLKKHHEMLKADFIKALGNPNTIPHLAVLIKARDKLSKSTIEDLKLGQAVLRALELEEETFQRKLQYLQSLPVPEKVQRVPQKKIIYQQEDAEYKPLSEEELQIFEKVQSMRKAIMSNLDVNSALDLKNFKTQPADVQSVVYCLKEVFGKKKQNSGKFLGNPRGLVNIMKLFADIKLPQSRLSAIQKYTRMEHFNPGNLINKSKAAGGFCQWILTLEQYAQYKKRLDAEGIRIPKQIKPQTQLESSIERQQSLIEQDLSEKKEIEKLNLIQLVNDLSVIDQNDVIMLSEQQNQSFSQDQKEDIRKAYKELQIHGHHRVQNFMQLGKGQMTEVLNQTVKSVDYIREAAGITQATQIKLSHQGLHPLPNPTLSIEDLRLKKKNQQSFYELAGESKDDNLKINLYLSSNNWNEKQDMQDSFKGLTEIYLKNGQYEKANEVADQLDQSRLENVILLARTHLGQNNLSAARLTLDYFATADQQEQQQLQHLKDLVSLLQDEQARYSSKLGQEVPERIKKWCSANFQSLKIFKDDYVKQTEQITLEQEFNSISHQLLSNPKNPRVMTKEVQDVMLKINLAKLRGIKDLKDQDLLEFLKEQAKADQEQAERSRAFLNEVQKQLSLYEPVKDVLNDCSKEPEAQASSKRYPFGKAVHKIIQLMNSKEVQAFTQDDYEQVVKWRTDNWGLYEYDVNEAYKQSKPLKNPQNVDSFILAISAKVYQRHGKQIEYTREELDQFYQQFKGIKDGKVLKWIDVRYQILHAQKSYYLKDWRVKFDPAGLNYNSSLFTKNLVSNPSQFQKVNLEDPEIKKQINGSKNTFVALLGKLGYVDDLLDENKFILKNPRQMEYKSSLELEKQLNLAFENSQREVSILTKNAFKMMNQLQNFVKDSNQNNESKLESNSGKFDYLGKKLEGYCPEDFDSDTWKDLYQNESDPEKSIQYLSRWIQEDGSTESKTGWITSDGSKGNYELRAEKLLSMKQYQLALEDAEQMIKSRNGPGNLMKARALLGMQQTELAVKLLSKEHADLVYNKQKEIERMRQENCPLPQQVYDWMMANCLNENLDRNLRYVKFAYQAKDQITKITSDPILLLIADPIPMFQKLQDTIEDVARVFKVLKTSQEKSKLARIIRYFIMSAPGQGKQATYFEYNKNAKKESSMHTLKQNLKKGMLKRFNDRFKNYQEHQDSFEICSSKNKATQLDGTIKDCLQVYAAAKFKNITREDEIHLISENIQISNQMKKKTVLDALTKEIIFFDQNYFNSGREHPQIEIYYSGHGLKQRIMLSSQEGLYYEFIYEHLVEEIQEHMKSLDYSEFPVNDEPVEWLVNIYVDACHSGSALLEGKKWAEQDKYYVERFDEMRNYSEYFVEAFKSDSEIFLKILLYSSTTPDELANDAGEGKGGKWTNHFLGKNMEPLRGKIIQGVNQDLTKAIQTTQLLYLDIYPKDKRRENMEEDLEEEVIVEPEIQCRYPLQLKEPTEKSLMPMTKVLYKAKELRDAVFTAQEQQDQIELNETKPDLNTDLKKKSTKKKRKVQNESEQLDQEEIKLETMLKRDAWKYYANGHQQDFNKARVQVGIKDVCSRQQYHALMDLMYDLTAQRYQKGVKMLSEDKDFMFDLLVQMSPEGQGFKMAELVYLDRLVKMIKVTFEK